LENIFSRDTSLYLKNFKSKYNPHEEIMNLQNKGTCNLAFSAWSFKNCCIFKVVIATIDKIYYRGGGMMISPQVQAMVSFKCEMFMVCPCTILAPINALITFFLVCAN
jgi:hypothetical protein